MEEIEVREADLSDFDFFYLIKCDEDNIYWAGHTLRPSHDDLYHFFYSIIQHPDALNKRTIFIVEEKYSGERVGYLYLDQTGSDSAEISIGILQTFSGKGYGRQAVCKLCHLAWNTGMKSISAMVREDNLRSQRMFLHSGFKKTGIEHSQFIQNQNREIKMIKFEKNRRGNFAELGSEFNLDLQDLKIVPNSFLKYMEDMQCCLFDSGRSALKAITHVIGDGCVLVPEYICESVIKCFPADRIIFFKLKENLQIDVNDLLNKIGSNTAAVYLVHYFGILQPEEVLSLLRAHREKYGFTIIEDTTHSIFTKKRTVGDYCVASLRKWFAVPNGGVLYTDKSSCLNLQNEICRSTDNNRAYAMMLKTLYINGQLESNIEYRRIFSACEEKLDSQKEINRISDFSEFLLGCNAVDDMVKKRKSNLNFLKTSLSNRGIRQICNFSGEDCPFVLPVFVPDRNDFRGYLMENRVYCAVHWPFDGFAREDRSLALSLSDHMLSLPIDQRYGEEEMSCLRDVIHAYKGRLLF